MNISNKRYMHSYAYTERLSLDLSLAENPLGPSKKVLTAIGKEVGKIHKYPDEKELLKLLAEYNNISEHNIIIGSGGNQLLENIIKIYSINKTILAPKITFIEPLNSLKAISGNVKYVELNEDYTLNLSNILKEIDDNVSLIYLCNPNNPTGIFHNNKEIIELANLSSVPILISEVGIDFVDESIINYGIHPNIIIVRSFSKAHGLAGARIGYIIANQHHIYKIKKSIGSFSYNSLAIAAAIAALNDEKYLRNSVNYILKEKEYLIANLKKLDFEVVNSQGQTFIAKVPEYYINVSNFCKVVSNYGISVVDCSYLEGLEKFIRISPNTNYINKKIIKILNEIKGNKYDK